MYLIFQTGFRFQSNKIVVGWSMQHLTSIFLTSRELFNVVKYVNAATF